jgi:hypothetical protein
VFFWALAYRAVIKKNIRFVPGFYKPRLAGMKGRKKRRAEGHTGKNLYAPWEFGNEKFQVGMKKEG